MKSRTTVFIILLTLVAVLIGGVRYYVIPKYYPQLLQVDVTKPPVAQAPNASPTATKSAQSPTHASIASVSAQLLGDLSPRQKVAQMIATPITVPADDSNKSIASAAATIRSEVPGFVTLFGQKVTALDADRLIKELRKAPIQPEIAATLQNLNADKRLLLQPMIGVDHEGGSVQRLSGEGMTVIPSAAEQCKMDRDQFVALLDRATKELRGVGIDVVFGPVVDLGANNPALKTRICSSDPDTVRSYGLSWVQAIQAQHMIPVLKHYPGIGQTTVDLHNKAETIPFDPISNSIFMSLLAANPSAGVMTTHVGLINDDGTASLPCTISESCVLKLKMQPAHLIFTDGLDMGGAQGSSQNASGSAGAAVTKQSLSELATKAIEAGHNVVVLGKTVTPDDIDQIVTDLADRYQRNPLFKQKVDQSLQLIWQTKSDHWSTPL